MNNRCQWHKRKGLATLTKQVLVPRVVCIPIMWALPTIAIGWLDFCSVVISVHRRTSPATAVTKELAEASMHSRTLLYIYVYV